MSAGDKVMQKAVQGATAQEATTQGAPIKQVDQVYDIGSIKQSISINDDLKYFRATFSVTSLDNKPYYLAIAADDVTQVKFQKIDKPSVSGTIFNEKDEYKPYSLILKSDEPCKVKIQMNVFQSKPTRSSSGSSSNVMNIVLVVILILALICLLYKK